MRRRQQQQHQQWRPEEQPNQLEDDLKTTYDTSKKDVKGTKKDEKDEKDTSYTRKSSMAPQSAASVSRRAQWLTLAVGSGTCAAFNGVFAKLTTTELTSTWATSISELLGFDEPSSIVELAVRATFFGLNLLFNGIMWGLFTAALARGTSTTQVSVVNVSANFLITALAGWAIFREQLPALWWGGAAMLVAGSVIVGRRSEGEGPKGEDASSIAIEEETGLLNRGGDQDVTDEEDGEEDGEPDATLLRKEHQKANERDLLEELDDPI